jgi:hypothetical protein
VNTFEYLYFEEASLMFVGGRDCLHSQGGTVLKLITFRGSAEFTSNFIVTADILHRRSLAVVCFKRYLFTYKPKNLSSGMLRRVVS